MDFIIVWFKVNFVSLIFALDCSPLFVDLLLRIFGVWSGSPLRWRWKCANTIQIYHRRPSTRNWSITFMSLPLLVPPRSYLSPFTGFFSLFFILSFLVVFLCFVWLIRFGVGYSNGSTFGKLLFRARNFELLLRTFSSICQLLVKLCFGEERLTLEGKQRNSKLHICLEGRATFTKSEDIDVEMKWISETERKDTV